MPSPASYTRENVAEIHLPGASVILRAALAALIESGARAAAPGEFTFRAFRNGRLTLGQAEAVEEIIRAGGDADRRRALSRLGDRGFVRVREWRDRLLDIAAAVEAALDFSEEDLDAAAAAGLAEMAGELSAAGFAISCAERGAGGEFPHVALVGLTNAGKSSLMNRLLDEDAVLVSSQASTTHDSLRRHVSWGGIGLILSDNPGYFPRAGGDAVDAAAERAFAVLGGEDVACWVVDASRPLGTEEEAFAARLRDGAVVVLNKCDLPRVVQERDMAELAARHGISVSRCVETSVKTGRGIDLLREHLAQSAASAHVAGPWSGREILELSVAGECCRAAMGELSDPCRLELAAEELRRGAAAFSRALGEGYAEEALRRIFSRFCIGK